MMPPGELLFSVLRALVANWLRSTLTLLGIIIGVGTLVALSSVMAGGLTAIARTVDTASGNDVVRIGIDRWNPLSKDDPPLTLKDREALARSRALMGGEALAQLRAKVEVRAGRRSERTDVVGTNAGAPGLYRLEVGRGRFFGAEDVSERRRVAVVGHRLASQLALREAPDGAFGEIAVEGERLRVIGVLADKPSLNFGNLNWNMAVAMPDATFVALRGQKGLETLLIKAPAAATTGDGIARLKRSVEALLAARGHPGRTLQIQGGADKNAGEAAFIQALRLLTVAVAAVCMLVGGINLMNIMLVSVTERKREIGLRLALGARKQDILRQFLLEAAALALGGSALGVASGLLFAWLASLVLGLVLGYWPYQIEPGMIAVGCLSALGTGLVFGWYPASRAAALTPIECLRSE